MLCDSCNISLSSDNLPSQTQTEALQDFLRSAQLPPDPAYYKSQLASFTTVLARYDTEILKLLADRASVQDYVDGCRAVLAPVRRLPAEILCEIFLFFSSPSDETTTDEYEELVNLAKFDLLQLSKVCSHWHRLIMGTPSLWSDIAVHLDCWPGYNPDSQLYLLKAALERGEGRLLTISFISDRRLSVAPERSLALLAEHCRRWQHLHLFVDSFADLNKISCVKGKLDSLQTLSLSSWSEQAFVEDIDIFERAPQLSKVSFGAVNPRCCPRLPWRQLQTFTYHFGQTVDFAAALSLMCNLSHPEARFEVRHLNAGRRFDLPAITSSVVSFLLTAYAASTSQAVGEVLSSLTLPHLRELSVNSSSNISPAMWPTTQFAALSHRSAFSTTLRSLDIRYVTIADDELILSLSSLASLESLVISDQQSTKTAVTDVLLRQLVLTSDPSSCLVPQLKFFDCTSLFLFSPPLYYEFIASRVVPGTAPFRAVLRGLFAYPSARDTFNRETFRMLFDLVASGSLQFQLAERYKVE